MNTDDEMLPEYAFTSQQGERGKYYQAYRQGHTVQIHKENGRVENYFENTWDSFFLSKEQVTEDFLSERPVQTESARESF